MGQIPGIFKYNTSGICTSIMQILDIKDTDTDTRLRLIQIPIKYPYLYWYFGNFAKIFTFSRDTVPELINDNNKLES